MRFCRLAVLDLPPMRSTYFRTLEMLPALALAGLWKQGDLTWATFHRHDVSGREPLRYNTVDSEAPADALEGRARSEASAL